MRRVLVSEYTNDGIIPKYEGWFHGISVDYEEFENGPGQFPVAIVEDDKGQLNIEYVKYVKFVEPFKVTIHPENFK